MATKTWKIEKDLCRCCHAEGAFDNLAEPRIFLEKEEVYSDMLKECLDIDIPPVPGELCTITYTICNACIVRLRDACNFKKQVLDCEQRFMTLYYKNAIQGIKPETKVKEELEVTIEAAHSDTEPDIVLKKEDEDDDDDHLMGGDDDDMSDDDIPIKQSLSVMKTRPKPKPKPKAPPVKKEKPPPKPKKKEEPKKKEPAKEKKGEDKPLPFTLTQNEDGTQQYSCNACDKHFKRRDLFAQHHKMVHLMMKHPQFRTCHVCKAKVRTRKRASHMETEHGIPAPSCGACGRKFAFPSEVLRHQKLFHMGEKNYQCDICDLKCRSVGHLKAHKMKHLPDRPFKCEICQKAFKWKSGLDTHMMIHLNVRPHVCKVCHEAFVQKSSLRYHLSRRHPALV